MYSPASSYASSPSSGGTPLKYKCEYCPQAFTFKFELASHERKDHTSLPEVMVVDEQENNNSENLEPKPNDNSGVQVPSQNEMDQSYTGYSENEESNTSSTKSRLKTLRRTNDRRSRDACQTNYNSDGKAEESSKSESESTPGTANTTIITAPIKNINIIKRERSYSIQDENVQSDLVITSVSSISSSSTNNHDHDENSNSSDSQRPSLRLRPRPSLSLSTSSSTTTTTTPSSSVPHKMEEKALLNPSSVRPKSHLRESNDKSQASSSTMTKTKTTTTMKKAKMRKSTGSSSHNSLGQCPLCPKAFSTFWNMKRHVKNNHPAGSTNLLRLENYTTKTATATNKPIVTKSTREEQEEEQEEEEEEEKPTSFPCGICSATFNKKSNRDVHERIHSGQKFKCAICHSEFSRPSTLIDHIKGRHMYKPPPPPTTNIQQQRNNTSISTLHSQRPVSQKFKGSGERFLCQYPSCMSTFSRRDSMLEHFKLVHLGERRFTCPYTSCKRKFGRKDQLNSHMVSHLSQNKKYTCDICAKECKSEHYLKNHKKVHSKKVKSIVCPVSGCKRRFFTQSDVNKHSKFAHAPKISSSLFHTAKTN